MMMDPGAAALASIIIPAHNEERSISRLLEDLQQPAEYLAVFEIIVVCNGCTDKTEQVARSASPPVSVLVTDVASKKLALRLGDKSATQYPRLFIDADVQIGAADVMKLVQALRTGDVLACAPRRVLPRDGVSWIVSWYYDVWEELPQVGNGLFGRGVIAVSEEGNRRVQTTREVMSDDLAMSEAFSPDERFIVQDAVVVVWPPKVLSDLINRRIRVVTGNAEADQAGLRGDSTKTSPRTLISIVQRRPALILRLPIFIAVTVVTRIKARRAIRRRDFTTWRRDESSRN